MHRILPVILVIAAVCLHFACCEWYYGEDTKSVTSEQLERTIYYRHRSNSYHRRGDYLPHNVILLSKSSVDKEDAKLYGVLVPVLMAGGAGLVFYVTRDTGGSGTP